MEEISRSDYLTLPGRKQLFQKPLKLQSLRYLMRELPGLQVRAYARLV